MKKSIDKFIEYEQGIRAGKVKRVSKGMRDKDGYWYKNETLIERLAITLEEQQYLKTIIGAKEKYRRDGEDKKIKQKAKRRNLDGLTQREQQKQDTIKIVNALKEQGLNNTEISKKLNMNVRSIRRILNSCY